MKIRIKYPPGQVSLTVFIILILAACSGRREETPAMPPLTSPLTQAQIGYGVINVSYTRVSSEPDETSASPGHLRRGSVVRVIERRWIRDNGNAESWVLIEEAFIGWLKETLVDVYDNEPQARTASEVMGN